MAPHCSTLAWKIPWTEEPGRLHGVAKSWTRLSDFTFTFHFHTLEKEMATHSRVLAWRISGTGEPGGLPSMELHRVRHDWSDSSSSHLLSPLYVSEDLTNLCMLYFIIQVRCYLDLIDEKNKTQRIYLTCWRWQNLNLPASVLGLSVLFPIHLAPWLV